jgi:hypothetical protein
MRLFFNIIIVAGFAAALITASLAIVGFIDEWTTALTGAF